MERAREQRLDLSRTVRLSLRHGGDHTSWGGNGGTAPRNTAGLTAMVEQPNEPPETTKPAGGFQIRPDVTSKTVTSQARPVEQPAAVVATGNSEAANGNGSSVRVTLEMFSPQTELCDTPFASHYVDMRDVAWLVKIGNSEEFAAFEKKRKDRKVSNDPEKAANYDAGRQQQIQELTSAAKRSINNRIYQTIMEDFDLPTIEAAYDFYETQRRHANEAVLGHGAQIYPAGTPYQLNNMMELPALPADLIELYVRSDTPPKLRHEIRRQFLLGHITAEVEMSARGGADHKLSQLQTLLDEKLYAGPSGQNRHRVLYGVFNSQTNQFDRNIGISDTEPADIPEGSHVKVLETSTRVVDQTGEEAFTMLGKKPVANGGRKGIRKAQIEQAKGNRPTGEIRPDLDVLDTHRMMVVTLGNSDSADRLTEALFDLIADSANVDYFIDRNIFGDPIPTHDGQPRGLPKDVIISDDSKVDESGKSDRYRRRRLQIPFDGMPNPVEIIIQTLAEHLDAELEVGEYIPEKGKYSGQAHMLMDIARERDINGILFDNKVYTGDEALPQPADHDKSTPLPRLSHVANELLETDHVMLGARKAL